MQVERLLDGYAPVAISDSAVDSPLRVIEEIGHCRIVITGSYHAGVFALSQGIPVVPDWWRAIITSGNSTGSHTSLAMVAVCFRLATPTLALDLQTMFRECGMELHLRPVLLSGAERQQRPAEALMRMWPVCWDSGWKVLDERAGSRAVAIMPGAWVVRSNALERYERVAAGLG